MFFNSKLWTDIQFNSKNCSDASTIVKPLQGGHRFKWFIGIFSNMNSILFYYINIKAFLDCFNEDLVTIALNQEISS